MGAAEAALRPAAVVRPDVDPGQDDLAMARAKRASDVEQHGLRGEAPLRAARRRDDAVGAEERAAVLDLHERPRPLDRGAAVGDALDLDARTGSAAPARRARRRSVAPGRRSRSISSSSASFDRLSTSRAAGSAAANASRPTWTEQPVTTISAAGFARRARRTAWRDFCVGRRGDRARVDEHEVRARRGVAVDDPDPALAQQPRRRLHLRLVDLAAEVRDRRGAHRRRGLDHHSCGFVLIRKPIVPTSAAIA